MILLSLILMVFTAQAEVLPSIFYASEEEIKSFCENPRFQTESYWRNATDQKITSLINEGDEVIQNSFVSLSYLELFQLKSQHKPSQFMAYVYANASHHLGRLVRFHEWPDSHPLKKLDQSLVKGNALKLVVYTARGELSRRLMFHSLNLYKELMWNLLPSSLCGAQYTLSFLSQPQLIKAFSATSAKEFIKAYVTYEQSYLQRSMYSDWIIGPSAKAKVLDGMRFISFNGKQKTSFHVWCASERCKTSSFDLVNRIQFDQYSILLEYQLTQNIHHLLKIRTKNANIRQTAEVFLSR